MTVTFLNKAASEFWEAPNLASNEVAPWRARSAAETFEGADHNLDFFLSLAMSNLTSLGALEKLSLDCLIERISDDFALYLEAAKRVLQDCAEKIIDSKLPEVTAAHTELMHAQSCIEDAKKVLLDESEALEHEVIETPETLVAFFKKCFKSVIATFKRAREWAAPVLGGPNND